MHFHKPKAFTVLQLVPPRLIRWPPTSWITPCLPYTYISSLLLPGFLIYCPSLSFPISFSTLLSFSRSHIMLSLSRFFWHCFVRWIAAINENVATKIYVNIVLCTYELEYNICQLILVCLDYEALAIASLSQRWLQNIVITSQRQKVISKAVSKCKRHWRSPKNYKRNKIWITEALLTTVQHRTRYWTK